MAHNYVMMIDDDATALQLHQMIVNMASLSDYFITISAASKALEVLKEINYKEPDNFPKYLLIDLNMPEMDGKEFIEAFENEFPDKLNKTKLVVITSSIREKDKNDVMKDHEVMEFLVKPIPKNYVRELIKKD